MDRGISDGLSVPVTADHGRGIIWQPLVSGGDGASSFSLIVFFLSGDIFVTVTMDAQSLFDVEVSVI